MRNFIRRGINRLRSHTSGNATLMVAVGMPALIGGAGLAVDIGQWYMWRRELQHSVDQAAIAAAWALTNPDSEATYEVRAEQEFDANEKITASFATEPTVALANFAGGTANSVIVTASASKRLPFSSLLIGDSVTISVRAQASFAEGMNFQACLIALNDPLTIGGNANVKAKCGLAALSCEENAVVIDGSATVETDAIATCGTASVPPENESVVNEHVEGLQDAYKDLVAPDSPGDKTYDCKGSGTGQKKTQIATLSAGTYKDGITVKCTTVLTSGIYVIDGGVLDLTANYNVTGTNVMFVLKNGATIKFGGNGNDNKVVLSPMLASDFLDTPYAAQAEDYEGILVFEDRNSHPGDPGHKLNGNSNSLIEGLVYLPNGEIEILGTADVASQCLQISAFRIRISGGANLETLCPADQTTAAGAAAAAVRLVA